MDRRIFLSSLLAFPLARKSFAAALPWTARFVRGEFDGEAYQAGLLIKLDPDWKTYWRNPGETGIPPQISAITSTNLENLTFSFPLPKRYSDDSGEAIGYHDEVLFPVLLKPQDFSKPIHVKLEAFFGVCQQVCTPAKIESELEFTPSSAPQPDADLIASWQARVPKLGTIAKSITLSEKSLVLDLTKPFTDIFVEGPDRYYFTKPDFDREAGKAWINIKGLKDSNDLKAIKLHITADDGGQGLEQAITLA